MFLNRDIKSYEQINKKLKIISQKSIIFLNKEDFICNSKIFECDALTNENKKYFMIMVIIQSKVQNILVKRFIN